MATAKKAAPKKAAATGGSPKVRDYKAERERTKLNKQAKEGGGKPDGATVPSKPETGGKGNQKPKAVINRPIDPEVCGTVDIPLSQIVSDPDQPRKFFDPQKLLELSKSIVQHNVIQPITVRPIAGGLFMVVCGERRFRGSLMANEAGHDVTTIPCQVREMTDEQAREIQLVENLQRADPHPIEEAFIFKKMLENQSIEDIAHRIDKSTKFVAMRIMLADLIPAFQEVFFADKMSLGQAVMLCKVNAEAQQAIFEDNVDSDWKDDEDFHLEDIAYLVKNESRNLDQAPFKTEDAELYPEMGACGKCAYNSGNNLVLFVEEEKSRICGNAVCYNIKCARAYKQSIEEVMTDPSIVFVARNYYTEEDKLKVSEVEKLNVPVLKTGSFKVVEIEEERTWEKYVEDREEDFNHDEITEEDFFNEIKPEYEEEIRDIRINNAEIANARAEGKVRKAFIVAGAGQGSIVEIIAITPQAELALSESDEDPAIKIQIAEINKREARAKEIDGEKVWQQVREVMLKAGEGTVIINNSPLMVSESAALAGAIYNAIGYHAQNEFNEEVLKLEDDTAPNVAKKLETLSPEDFNILCRLLIREKMFPLPGSHLASDANYLGFKVAKEYFPEQVANIESIQAVKAEQRAQRAQKKIEELQPEKEEA